MTDDRYQCESASIVLEYAGVEKVVVVSLRCGRVRPGPFQCLECKRLRDGELVKGIMTELEQSPLVWTQTHNGTGASVRRNLARYGTRYLALPQERGDVFIYEIKNKLWLDGQPMPDAKEEIERLVSEWSNTPEERRISGTRQRVTKSGEVIRLSWGATEIHKRRKFRGRSYRVNAPSGTVAHHLEAAGAFQEFDNGDGLTSWYAGDGSKEAAEAALINAGLVVEPAAPVTVDHSKAFVVGGDKKDDK